MELKRNYHLRLQDEEKLANLTKEDPNLVLSEKRPQFTPEFFKMIGIDYEAEVLGKGYLKLFWSDFIVEEIASDGRIISIAPTEENHQPSFSQEKPKTEADLIKQGMPTFEAIERLSEALNLPVNAINQSGLKDSGAITSQEISFNGLRPEKLQNLQIPNLFLKNIHERKGVMEVGNLYGNRFTILVRGSGVEKEKLQAKINELNTQGFLNFYSLQRFGSRFYSHKIGEEILKGNYQEAVKMFLIGESPHEMNVFRKLRGEARNYWGNWERISEIYNRFPYFLYYELVALESLKETRIGFVKALQSISEQTKLFVYAYFSFLFNKLLSKKISEGQIPQELPLLRDYPEIRNEYATILSHEEMSRLRFYHQGLEFLNLPKIQRVKTQIIPKIWSVSDTNSGYVFHFDLEKGAYATTLLSEFFHLFQGKPVPDWVSGEEVDIRQPLGYPPIKETISKFPIAEKKEGIDLSEG